MTLAVKQFTAALLYLERSSLGTTTVTLAVKHCSLGPAVETALSGTITVTIAVKQCTEALLFLALSLCKVECKAISTHTPSLGIIAWFNLL